MPIINKETPYLYTCVDNKIHKQIFGNGLFAKLFTDANCYVLGMGDVNVLRHLKDLIDKEILTELKNNKIELLIIIEFEPLLEIVDIIYSQLILEKEISENNILLVSCTFDIVSEIKKISAKYNKKKIKSFCFSTAELLIKRSVESIFYMPKNLQKTKKFICLNRRWRLHRPFLIGLLNHYNLLDSGYVSLGESDFNLDWHSVKNKIVELHSDFSCPATFDIFNNDESIKSIPKLYVDTTDLVTNHISIEKSINRFYQTSYFSVVTETLYFTDLRFLSEKTFKPIALRHPFILVSAPNILPILHRLGYKTFHPFINEDYDKETNHCKRMKLIVDEVQRLCNLSDEEWIELNKELQPIISYNKNHLSKKSNIYNFVYPLT